MNKKNKKLKIQDQINSNTPKTTGHSWDGIEEYENPDPMWLRVVFYCVLVFSLVYWMIYPSWPTSSNSGFSGWTSYKQLAADQQEIIAMRSKYQAILDKSSFADIIRDPELLKFAMAGGESAFINNCAVCHGVGGGGNIGYPNLTTGAWLWGGTLEEIYQTLRYGIRAAHEQTRDSNMAAFGKEKLLTKEQVNAVVDYVQFIGKLSNNNSELGATIFAQNCASCHGADGKGSRLVGAPNLTDAIWLYGSDRAQIFDVVWNGRAGVMPAWINKLSDSTIMQLAIYVHSLGGGE